MGFVDGDERGKRHYLRKMAKIGEWADHIMVMATACFLKVKLMIYAVGGVTEVGPTETFGEEITLGYVCEEHYFGAKREMEPAIQHQD